MEESFHFLMLFFGLLHIKGIVLIWMPLSFLFILFKVGVDGVGLRTFYVVLWFITDQGCLS